MQAVIAMLVAAFAVLASLATGALASPRTTLTALPSLDVSIDPTNSTGNDTYSPIAAVLPKHRNVRRANWDSVSMASDALWCRAQGKGAEMYATFWKSDIAAGRNYNPPRNSANSPFRNDNLPTMMYHTWGWSDADSKHNDAVYNDWYGAGWMQAVRELGIGIEPWRDIWSYHYGHGVRNLRDEHGQPWPLGEQSYTAYGKQYRVTGARAKFGVNDRAGAIIVDVAVSPASAFAGLYNRPANPEELPQLRALSDLLWAGWTRGSNPHVGNPNPANLNYMFMMGIVNDQTLSVMKRALANKGKNRYSIWPGDDFPIESPEGQALLGTPNGKPFGYLVNQRKLDMGYKMIYNIRVFAGDMSDYPIMMVYLHPLRPDQIQNN